MEYFRRKPHTLMSADVTTVRCVDARALLPAMLEGKESEECDTRSVLISVNGKNAAFFTGLAFCYKILRHQNNLDLTIKLPKNLKELTNIIVPFLQAKEQVHLRLPLLIGSCQLHFLAFLFSEGFASR